MTRSLVLCADDFGLTDGINRAIVELIDLGRLSATSCMTTMPAWTEDAAAALVARHDRAALGLHFNLTEGDTAMPLGKLMQQSLLGKLDTDWVQRALNQQLDRFEALTGLPPDFIDGHQHIQMFPGIRTIVLQTLQQRYQRQRPWIRVSNPAIGGHDAGFKAVVLRLMGLGFERQRRQHAVAGNRSFAGMYSLQSDAGFERMLQHWLQTLPEGALIMCHPGHTDGQSGLACARQQEYDWLASDAFSEALQQSHRSLTLIPALD
jgi:predicted glycoside hydrolase/deacetylase ChbG (UPF0249 family)